MGSDSTSVTVGAATLAGGPKNQDRHAWGDGWAFVLDGASSFETDEPEHDGGWYAERLRDALAVELASCPTESTATLVARAIRDAARAHDDPHTCPSSTVALARWDIHRVELYVLGDSTAAIATPSEEIVLTDSRIATVGTDLRSEYRARLRAGHGFDERHKQILRQLQMAQASVRNTDNGYWIASNEPTAATHALVIALPIESIQLMTLATDGAEAGRRYGVFETWAEAGNKCEETLTRVREVEREDGRAIKWPRSKPHDDKTLMAVQVAS